MLRSASAMRLIQQSEELFEPFSDDNSFSDEDHGQQKRGQR
jgi:hypothetical protein